MSFTMNPAIKKLIGSEIRAKVLALLADASEPKTGYKLSKDLRISPSKVYGTLRMLEGTGFLGTVSDRSGRKRYFLANEDLRRLLLKNARIAVEEDWFSPARMRDREEAIESAKRLKVEIPLSRRRPRNLEDFSEFVRPREKDWALRRVAAKSRITSRRRRQS